MVNNVGLSQFHYAIYRWIKTIIKDREEQNLMIILKIREEGRKICQVDI